VRLTVCARVFPDGKLEGTVGAAESDQLPFEGWLEFLAVLTSLLNSTHPEPT
jgi:hypothetical protein